ncbi:MAG: hypothetical protein IKS62_04270 [Aeriscardovia sp.]|nr:hypothetical protein [Aeriscardovia sp.]
MGDNHAAITCLNCGAENAPGSRFCSICGWPLLAPPTKPGEMPPLPTGVAQFEAMETMPIAVQQQTIEESAKGKAEQEPATQETVAYTDEQNPDDAFTGGSPSEDFVEEQTEENPAIAPSTTMMTVTKRAAARRPQPTAIMPKPPASSMTTTLSATNRTETATPGTTAGATSAAVAAPGPRRRSAQSTATPQPVDIPPSIAPEHHPQTSSEAEAAPPAATPLPTTTSASNAAAEPSARQTPATDRAEHNPGSSDLAVELPASPLETALTKPALDSTTLFLDDDLAIPNLPGISGDKDPRAVASEDEPAPAIGETPQDAGTVLPKSSATSPATTAPASTRTSSATATRHAPLSADSAAGKTSAAGTIGISKPAAAAAQSASAQHTAGKTSGQTASDQRSVAAAMRKTVAKPRPAKKPNQHLEAAKRFFRTGVIAADERAEQKKAASQKAVARCARSAGTSANASAPAAASTKASAVRTVAEPTSLSDRAKNFFSRPDTVTAAKDIAQQRTPREKRRIVITLVVAFLVVVALSLVLGHFRSESASNSSKPSSGTSASARPAVKSAETKPAPVLDAGLVSQASQQYANSGYGFSVDLPQSFAQSESIGAGTADGAARRGLPVNSTASGAVFMDPNRAMSVSAWGQSTTAGQTAASVCADEQRGSGHSDGYVYQQGARCVVSYEANGTIYYDDAYVYSVANGRSYFLEIQYPAASKSVGGELVDKIVASYVPGPAQG